jgi:hypothetical protein
MSQTASEESLLWGGGFDLLHPLQCLKAVHERHIHINQHDFRFLLLEHRNGLFAVSGFKDGSDSELIQYHSDELADVGLVVSHQNWSVEFHAANGRETLNSQPPDRRLSARMVP